MNQTPAQPTQNHPNETLSDKEDAISYVTRQLHGEEAANRVRVQNSAKTNKHNFVYNEKEIQQQAKSVPIVKY